MVEYVLGQASSYGCTLLIDTYCGSGLFALCGARRFDRVWGVEVSSKAVQAAKRTAELNDINNTEFVSGVAENIFGAVSTIIPISQREKAVVIIDPPRAGCDEKFLIQLFKFGPRQLVYVSCDPATQARDARIIVAAGYNVTSCTPFDLFPQTRHIENVMVFLRN